MASLLFFLFLSSFSIAAAQQTQFNVSLGSFLTPTKNNSWFSPSGRYAFGFYQQANGYAVGIFLAGIPHKTLVWTANRDQPVSSNTTLQFTSSGSLILRSSQGREISIANTITAASYASMLDSGNFVLYSSDQEIIWQSFEHPTDTLLPGQKLSTEAKLISSVSETDHSTGMFCLRMQSDGNLVQYPVEYPYGKEYAYWSSNTYGNFSVTLNLDDDGHLYFLDGTGSNIKNLTDGYPMEKTIYLMRIDPDGIFRLYSHSLDENSKWSILWSSTTDRCDPKGLCGPNSYCVANDQKADCQCIPGFEFANQSNRSSGCKSNFIEDSCTKRHESIEYTIEELPNMEWRMDPYLVQSVSTKEECKTACSEDCNCGAAVFRVGECSKLQLPLRYGKLRVTDSMVYFVKLAQKDDDDHHRLVVIILLPIAVVSFLLGFIMCYLRRRVLKSQEKESVSKLGGNNIEYVENIKTNAPN